MEIFFFSFFHFFHFFFSGERDITAVLGRLCKNHLTLSSFNVGGMEVPSPKERIVVHVVPRPVPIW